MKTVFNLVDEFGARMRDYIPHDNKLAYEITFKDELHKFATFMNFILKKQSVNVRQ
jgi:hypothetical protein